VAEWVVDELVIPATVDAVDAADYLACADIINRNEAEAYGTAELWHDPSATLPWWQDPANPHRLFAVRVDGEIAGCGVYEYLAADTTNSWMRVNVLSDHRGRGVGSALAEHAEAIARAEGRSKILSYFPSPEGPGDRIPAPTGFGSVPAGNPEVRFALRQGYRLEQVERGSRLALPTPVAFTAPDDYRLHYWIDSTPPEWREQVAILNTRMSTDAPTAGLDEPEDVVTVERLLEQEAGIARSPNSFLTAAVEHVPTGVLAGFTVLSAPAELDRGVSQYSTLVLREHRGHGLGMLLKLANIDHLQRVRPGHPSIVTFNAEENRHMLDVNEQLGFVPIGYEGAWRRDL
jgi:GNAT superfamily N-acetyltransferase